MGFRTTKLPFLRTRNARENKNLNSDVIYSILQYCKLVDAVRLLLVRRYMFYLHKLRKNYNQPTNVIMSKLTVVYVCCSAFGIFDIPV